MRALIEKGEYKEANQALAFVQSAFEQGSINDREADKAFSAFEHYIPAMAETLENWVEAMPNSYVARLARAKYLVAKAGFYRGYGLPREVSQEHWDVFGACLKRANEDLQRSLELTAKPVLTHAVWMHMCVLTSGDFDHHYQAAVQLYPQSLEARGMKMWRLRAEWGGSLEQLKEYVDSDEHAGLPQEERAFMQSKYYEARGHWFAHFERDKAQAKKAYEKSLEIKRSAGTLAKLADLVAQDSLAQAMPLIEEARSLSPDDMDIQASYAALLYQFSSYRLRRAEARKLLEEAADWGDWSAHQVLNHLKNSAKPADRARDMISVLAWAGKWLVRIAVILALLIGGLIFWVTFLWKPNIP